MSYVSNESTQNVLRSRIFISCGQQKGESGGNEALVAEQIAVKLDKLDYQPYVSILDQTVAGLKENIFRKLSESEYFIFIDFKREKLDNGPYHRGSLFSNQELAIAAFLGDIEVLGFQELGVKPMDGILSAIQGNFMSFSDRHLLPDVVSSQVQDKWRTGWRNELFIDRSDSDWRDVPYVGGQLRPERYYHIRVCNRHRQKVGRNCVAFVEQIKNLSTGEVTQLEPVEVKWKGVRSATVNIPPRRHRFLDAFHVFRDSQRTIHLPLNPFIVDYTGYLTEIDGTDSYELTYAVFSENFSTVKETFRLHAASGIDQIGFFKLSGQ